MQVWEEHEGIKREIPKHIRKYLFTLRHQRVIQRNGVSIDVVSYYAKKMIEYIGQKVEVRLGMDHAAMAHIFSLPDRKFMFDAALDEWTGNVKEDIEKVNRERKEAKAILKKYNRKKKEF
jgi:hypothetical protein